MKKGQDAANALPVLLHLAQFYPAVVTGSMQLPENPELDAARHNGRVR